MIQGLLAKPQVYTFRNRAVQPKLELEREAFTLQGLSPVLRVQGAGRHLPSLAGVLCEPNGALVRKIRWYSHQSSQPPKWTPRQTSVPPVFVVGCWVTVAVSSAFCIRAYVEGAAPSSITGLGIPVLYGTDPVCVHLLLLGIIICPWSCGAALAPVSKLPADGALVPCKAALRNPG